MKLLSIQYSVLCIGTFLYSTHSARCPFLFFSSCDFICYRSTLKYGTVNNLIVWWSWGRGEGRGWGEVWQDARSWCEVNFVQNRIRILLNSFDGLHWFLLGIACFTDSHCALVINTMCRSNEWIKGCYRSKLKSTNNHRNIKTIQYSAGHGE